jgi:hypothetical protein
MEIVNYGFIDYVILAYKKHDCIIALIIITEPTRQIGKNDN